MEGLGKHLWKWKLYGGVRPLEFPFIEKVWVAVRPAAQYLGPAVYPVFPQRGEFAQEVGCVWEGLIFTRAAFIVEVNRDPRRDGSGNLVARPDFRAPHRVEVGH